LAFLAAAIACVLAAEYIPIAVNVSVPVDVVISNIHIPYPLGILFRLFLYVSVSILIVSLLSCVAGLVPRRCGG